MAVVGKKTVSGVIGDIVIYAFAALLTFVFVYPFYVVICISLNDATDLVRGYPLLVPRVFSIFNYQAVLSSPLIPRATLLSLGRTLIVTFFGTFGTSMFAYSLSKPDMPGRKLFNTMCLIILYFGGGLVATYIVYNALGLINNFWVMVLPSFFGVYYMLIIRSYYNGLPSSVEEAAYIDGANDLQIFILLILPMSLPVLAAIAIYNAVGQWNSWWDNYIYANSDKLCTLQLLLVRLIKDADVRSAQMSAAVNETSMSPLGIRMACTVFVTVPILVVYPFFQKYFIKGITIGAVKG
jgi:putative aldouronate transport system permease protein